ncbi:hypothetical protein GCM10027034_13540 [Ramlibacter solisilvae]|uniref:Outer membrane protein beta-barrel domain-containing protein n=1 Tax=Ramlibacter tataouinensis TaxID=94132 RepID=A0A127K0P4_9BURK|nr:hypothetical protein [Ramlibacter tataouinensis]AMO24392.1 hypothetical protein UC35_18055 [Ramlibacter tataouinensis]
MTITASLAGRARLNRALLVACMAAGLGAAQAQTAPPADRWSYAVTPYIWLPGFDGTLKYALPPGTGSPDVSVNENRVLDAIDAFFMISGEARRGRLSFFGDYIYLKLSSSKSDIRSIDFNAGAPVNPLSTTVNRETSTRIDGNVLTLAGGYQISGTPDAPFDLIGGVRYFGVQTQTQWNFAAAVAGPGPGQSFAAAGTVSRNADLWDAIVGARGRARIADRWFVPIYLDVGAGSSKLTWQALVGIGYSFGWGDISLSGRTLFYDQDDNKLLQDFKFSGGMLGATFRF